MLGLFTIEPRKQLTQKTRVRIFLLSVVWGLVAIGVVFLFMGVNPLAVFWKIFAGSFGSWYGIKATIGKAVPLILIATGLAVAYKGKFWNIGAESQLLMGAAFATGMALFIGPQLPGWLLVPLMIIAGFIGGALWAIPPAILKLRFGISEVISTLMLNYIGAEVIKYLVVGPWKGQTQYGYPYTDDIPEQAVLTMFHRSPIAVVTLILALAAAVILYVFLYRSRYGYEVRVLGENKEAARYAGIRIEKTTIMIMIISGGVAGIAGFGELAAMHHHLTYPDIISSGYGFTAIIVAWLSGLNPLLTIFSGLFFAGIIVGGDAIQISFGLPAATVDVFNGFILIFLIMGDYFLKNRIVWRKAVAGGAGEANDE